MKTSEDAPESIESRRMGLLISLHKEQGMTTYKTDAFFGSLTGNGRILVVEDDSDVRRAIRLMLEKAGYDILEAADGQAAIEAIHTGENQLVVDAIICDMRMPKINGLQAIAYFKTHFPHVPVVVLTGFPDTEMAVSCLRDGVVDYLVKPVDSEHLQSAISRAMAQRELAWR
jgi:two-component system chemotaxis response regulator CheY